MEENAAVRTVRLPYGALWWLLRPLPTGLAVWPTRGSQYGLLRQEGCSCRQVDCVHQAVAEDLDLPLAAPLLGTETALPVSRVVMALAEQLPDLQFLGTIAGDAMHGYVEMAFARIGDRDRLLRVLSYTGDVAGFGVDVLFRLPHARTAPPFPLGARAKRFGVRSLGGGLFIGRLLGHAQRPASLAASVARVLERLPEAPEGRSGSAPLHLFPWGLLPGPDAEMRATWMQAFGSETTPT